METFEAVQILLVPVDDTVWAGVISVAGNITRHSSGEPGPHQASIGLQRWIAQHLRVPSTPTGITP